MSIVQPPALSGNERAASKRVLMSKKNMMIRIVAGCVLVTGLVGCETRQDRAVKLGRMIVTNAKGNHPIRVSKQMIRMKIPVRRGDYGLNSEKKMELGNFVEQYRREGEGKLILSAPAGQPNEVAAFNVLNDIRDSMKSHGIVRQMVRLRPYSPKGDPEAPIIISYLGYKAEGPKCGPLTRDVGGEYANRPGEQLACANQANFAAMVANPRDLVEPRDESPRSGERRDQLWDKYVKGDSTETKKSKDQKTTLSSAVGN